MLTDLLTVSPQALLLVCATALVAGLARGFSGFGGALIFVPLASAAIGPARAIPLLLIVDLVMAAPMIPDAWRKAERRDVALMASGALVGVPAGTWVLAQASPLFIRWAIVGLVVTMLALLVSGWRYHGRPRARLTVLVGALSGFCSGAAQAGGPPVVAYWLGASLPRWTVRANIVAYFAVSSVLSVVTYATSGLLVRETFVLSALLAPAYGIALYAGSRMFGVASEETFRRLCYTLIALAAIVSLPLFDGWLR
jgi:uncharacterized membrane protein YfcA